MSYGTEQVTATRIAKVTPLPFELATARFEHTLGHWNDADGAAFVKRKAPWTEVQARIWMVANPHGLMIFHKVDQGTLTSLSGKVKHCALYLVGNPDTANSIIDIDLRGSMYVPFRVCILQEHDAGVATILYDKPSTFLAQFAEPGMSDIGADLDRKIAAVVDLIK